MQQRDVFSQEKTINMEIKYENSNDLQTKIWVYFQSNTVLLVHLNIDGQYSPFETRQNIVATSVPHQWLKSIFQFIPNILWLALIDKLLLKMRIQCSLVINVLTHQPDNGIAIKMAHFQSAICCRFACHLAIIYDLLHFDISQWYPLPFRHKTYSLVALWNSVHIIIFGSSESIHQSSTSKLKLPFLLQEHQKHWKNSDMLVLFTSKNGVQFHPLLC